MLRGRGDKECIQRGGGAGCSPGPAVEPNGPPEALIGLVEVRACRAPGRHAEPKPASDPPHLCTLS